MIGIILPSRGMVFTRVEEAIESYRLEFDVRVYRSHSLPIPDGHNLLAKEALEDGCTHLWFVEEDTVPPPRTLEKLLGANAAIACVDYGVSGWGCVTRNTGGEILWCGLGCTLVARKVIEALDYPYFRADKVLSLNDWTWKDLPQEYIRTKQYGSLDIWFCCQARKKGFEIVQVEGECDHLELLELGKRETNNGLHQIGFKPKIINKQTLKEVSF